MAVRVSYVDGSRISRTSGDVVAELRPRPTLNSGAVALEEPDDELDSDSDIYRDAVRHSPPNNVDGDSRCET